MGTKGTLALIGLSMAVGFSINSCSDPVPETRIVKVPSVHVVTKTVDVKSDPIPIPNSCLKAFALAQEISEPDSAMTESSGAILALMSDVERNALRDDFKAMNEALEKVRTNRDTLDTAALDAADARAELEVAVSICKNDLGKR